MLMTAGRNYTYFGHIFKVVVTVPGRDLCREPSSRPRDGCLRSRTGGFIDTRPRAVVGKQDGLMPVLGRAA